MNDYLFIDTYKSNKIKSEVWTAFNSTTMNSKTFHQNDASYSDYRSCMQLPATAASSDARHRQPSRHPSRHVINISGHPRCIRPPLRYITQMRQHTNVAYNQRWSYTIVVVKTWQQNIHIPVAFVIPFITFKCCHFCEACHVCLYLYAQIVKYRKSRMWLFNRERQAIRQK